MNHAAPRPPHPSLTRRSFLASTFTTALAVASARSRTSRADDTPPLRAAVIGHTGRGDYGHGLEAIFLGRPGIETVAVADPDAAAREKVAARIGAPRHYADYREMLAKERPRLVSIAMRQSDQHHEIGLACLRAGAHCYFEKPFTRTPAESDELLAEARSRRLKTAVAHTMRMTTPIVRLRREVADGLIGELRELRAYGKQDARAGGEDMMVLGSHLFDLLRMFCGDPIAVSSRVLVDGRPIEPTDRRLVKDNVGWVAGDQVFAAFEFAKGVQATFTSDARLRETVGHWGIEFHGSKGVARINCDIAPHVFVRPNRSWTTQGRTDAWKPLDPPAAAAPPEHNLGPVGDWLDAIKTDREPQCSGVNGAWAVEMVMGVYASSLSGTRTPFPLHRRGHPLDAS